MRRTPFFSIMVLAFLFVVGSPSMVAAAGSCICSGDAEGVSFSTPCQENVANEQACKAQIGSANISDCTFYEFPRCAYTCGNQACIVSDKKCSKDSDCNYGGVGLCKDGFCNFDAAGNINYNNTPKVSESLLGIQRNVDLQKPTLSIRIPGVNFTDIKNTVDADGYIHLPWIGEYIAGIYKFLLGTASILAVFMIIINGARIVTSGGGEGQATAYNHIGRVIIGLVILWGSYFILNTINPDLTKFQAMRILYIPPQPLPLDETEDDDATGGQQIKPGVQNIVTISGAYMQNSMKVGSDIAADLTAASQELYSETTGMKGGPYKLAGGGYRPVQGADWSQVEKWKRQCAGKATCGTPVCNPFPKSMVGPNNTLLPNATPDPTLCPHTSGLALDIYCSGYDTDKFFAPCQRKLEEILLRKNFCRLTSEPWHFERPKMSGTCTNITGIATRNSPPNTWDYKTCAGIYTMKTKQCDAL